MIVFIRFYNTFSLVGKTLGKPSCIVIVWLCGHWQRFSTIPGLFSTTYILAALHGIDHISCVSEASTIKSIFCNKFHLETEESTSTPSACGFQSKRNTIYSSFNSYCLRLSIRMCCCVVPLWSKRGKSENCRSFVWSFAVAKRNTTCFGL